MYLVYESSMMKLPISGVSLDNYNTSIFECEYIPKEVLNETADPKYYNTEYYIPIYDTLVYKSKDIWNMYHENRLATAQIFVNLFVDDPKFIFEVKDFLIFRSVEEFFYINNIILNKIYPYHTDGIMYTPFNYKYDISVNELPISQRNLKYHPDIVKWKPPSQLTIDFAIHRELDYIDLLSGQGENLVPFRVNGFNIKTDLLIVPDLLDAPDKSVFEFAWNQNRFIMIQPRFDKLFPNKLEVALDNWNSIQKPIDELTIRGQKFSLLPRYFNREKSNLFNMAKEGLPQTPTRTLLDVGSGRGGDVDKWIKAGFTHVICIEYDENNIVELKERLNGVNIKCLIIETKGQDYTKIIQDVKDFVPNGKVDTISYMLSLSFFFDRVESIYSILYLVGELLSSGGYFIALSIDGDSVQEYFKHPQNYTTIDNCLKANMQLIDFRLCSPTYENAPWYVFVNIPGTIVTNYIEYLTDLSQLQHYLQNSTIANTPIGMKLISQWKTDRE